MAVAIRLKRTGKHKQPYYRVVAIERRQSAQGQPLEVLGFYDPRAVEIKDKLTLNQERYDYWVKVGAKPSETVAALLNAVVNGKEGKKKVKKSRKQVAKEKAAVKAKDEKPAAKPAADAPADDKKAEAKKEDKKS